MTIKPKRATTIFSQTFRELNTPPIGNTVENSRGFDRLASDAMEKSLANGGLATIASMIKKNAWTEKACARNKPGRKGIEMSNSFLGTSLCLGR